MGVFKLFPSITNKYKNNVVFTLGTIKDSAQAKINLLQELHLDANCLLHPVCMKVYAENKSMLKTNRIKLEFMMVTSVIEYIEMLISLVNPTELVNIVIDGVAPFAKNHQQHSRRYKSVYDSMRMQGFAKKYEVSYNKPWNNSAITPGTPFMHHITDRILNYLMMKQEQNKDSLAKVKYMFSSAYTPDEGEHKILQYIRNNRLTPKTRAIYGLDADLIYLSMASNVENIFLMREMTEFQTISSPDGFCFLSIDNLKQGIYEDLTNDLVQVDQTEYPNLIQHKNAIIQDYIFFGFMIGNDFMPHLPSVNLRFNKKHCGLNLLTEAYKYSFLSLNQDLDQDYVFLTNNDTQFRINYAFLKEMLVFLVASEESYFSETFRFKRKTIVHPKTFDEEVKSYEMLTFYVRDLFRLGNRATPHTESKRLFYEYYSMQDTNAVCEEYIKGLLWNGNYYFNECQDYLWHYPYDKSPFVSDLIEWILGNQDRFEEIMNIYPLTRSNRGTISPLEQLMLVLPVQSAYLLPRGTKHVMLQHPLIFPTKFDIDLQDVGKMWQAKPKIPTPNVPVIKQLLSTISLTKEDEQRNVHRENYHITI
jgi:5'-3' exonuclease